MAEISKKEIKEILRNARYNTGYDTVQATRVRKDAVELVYVYGQDLDLEELAAIALKSACRHGHIKTIMLEDVRGAILEKREPVELKFGFQKSYAEFEEKPYNGENYGFGQ
jgi:histone H3/H4